MTDFDWTTYNAELSMRNAMDMAGKCMKAVDQGSIPTPVAEVQLHMVDTWVHIAQVHATNMTTEAIRAQQDNGWCKCQA